MFQATAVGRLKKFLYHATRSRSFLWKVALGTLAGSIAVGFVLSRLPKREPHLFAGRVLARAGLSPEKPDPENVPTADLPQVEKIDPPDILTPFRDELTNPAVQFRDVLDAVPALAAYFQPGQLPAVREALKPRFAEQDAALILDYLAAWRTSDPEPYERLKAAGGSPAPLRYANYALGRVEMERKNFAAAYRAFRREAEHPEASESRWAAVNALVQGEDFGTLRELERDATYAPFFSPYVRTKLAVHQRDWRSIIKWIPLGQLDSYEWPIIVVSLIAGCAWAFFLGHLGEWPSLFSGTALLCTGAVILGILSTTPTLYLVVLEDDILHVARGGEPINIFLYNIGGVGLREEFCKLLMFLPLLPFLIRRGNELEALIVACFVGLGFAVEENAGYFMHSAATDVAGRFLSANFFHIALTGVNGLALFRAFLRGRGGWNDFLFVFPVTVLAHGIYDALLGLPDSDFSGYLAMTVYIAFSMFFFNRASQLRRNARMTIGLTGAFVFAISVVVGTVMIYQMMNLGAHAGMLVVVSEILGSAALVFMFFREFDEQLSL